MSSSGPAYRDRSGRTLAEYPRPSVAVDTAVLTIAGTGALAVLLVADGDGAASAGSGLRLPGTFLHEGETLSAAVLRSMREKAGVPGLAPRQLHVFDDPARDERGWVLSVAHLDVVRRERISASARARLVPVDAVPALPFDHGVIVGFAAEELRVAYRGRPDPWGLVDRPFTMRELRRVHEAVAGERLLPDTFRRAMLPWLRATGEKVQTGRGRPAELYADG
ncbi:NUDIX hydrolase [Microbacterium sp. LRZ72]|uniref:NUDIX hydrolase n=1 Tax=Microbacterium sp. LRZ72 TaxID=2942481 RepID=UPI0029A8DB74|nr:NUDIX domain-containing protein [Microbacterium sp. LRZ72]MDX2375199.1 NUDIX hydrolase [Microbacterium sp. LRZ72]